ncbi:transcriptional regulator [Candidatus Nitrososphaera evergladensis SR1]|uniref:Transcriptional regulator n=1 Tax=Candidatus Nitrososphaera evergladensis SR1 TaxID=1459636 RepID=A0A075MQJ5_9ARCH|nr:winged helix-turn-helix transcriptional regulator [Candidatus Nitrososphaera evergladensis]AIF83355.1 transcriptional regulator [Candidatus Nitrososphaera evergladensis SR1]
MAKAPTFDKTDIDIIRMLLRDCRVSYRSIGSSVGLSKNAAKTRVDKMVSTGVISAFVMSVNPAVFGYHKICHLIIRDSKTMEETLNRLRLLGEPLTKLDCVGGISLIIVAIKEREEERISLLAGALKPAIVKSCIVGQYPPVRQELRETDFKILKCLMASPRMGVSEIAKRVSISSKTVSSRLLKMKENRILDFRIYTDPTKMQGYVRFGMVIRLEGKNSQKTSRQIHEELEKNFVMAFPMVIQQDVVTWQLIARSMFDIDPALKRIELLDGVKGVEVFIPFRADTYQDWMLKEIDSRIKHAKGAL